jgi:hypothetical protein
MTQSATLLHALINAMCKNCGIKWVSDSVFLPHTALEIWCSCCHHFGTPRFARGMMIYHQTLHHCCGHAHLFLWPAGLPCLNTSCWAGTENSVISSSFLVCFMQVSLNQLKFAVKCKSNLFFVHLCFVIPVTDVWPGMKAYDSMFWYAKWRNWVQYISWQLKHRRVLIPFQS